MRKIFHGYRVGCGNAPQFMREYKRLFGMPPMRDIKQLRATVTEGAAEFCGACVFSALVSRTSQPYNVL